MLDVPGRRIGHFGFFRSEMESTLWPRALAVLERWRSGSSRLTPRGQPSVGIGATFTKMQRTATAAPQPRARGEIFSETP